MASNIHDFFTRAKTEPYFQEYYLEVDLSLLDFLNKLIKLVDFFLIQVLVSVHVLPNCN